MTNAPAGWYPNGPEWETWWDGTAWTDQHRPVVQPPQPDKASENVLSVRADDEVPQQASAETPPTPMQLGKGGVEVTRTDTGLEFRAHGLLNKGVLGGAERTVAWDEDVSLEQIKNGLKVRARNFAVQVLVPKHQLAVVPDFISAAIAQRDEYVLANPAVAPTVLDGSGASMERTADGFTIRVRGRLDRAAMGSESVAIPWLELLTIEAAMGGVRVRWGRK